MKRTTTSTTKRLPDGTEVTITEWNSGCLGAVARWWPILFVTLTVHACALALLVLWRVSRACALALWNVFHGGAK